MIVRRIQRETDSMGDGDRFDGRQIQRETDSTGDRFNDEEADLMMRNRVP